MLYAVDQFVSDVDGVLSSKGETVESVWAIGPMLQRLVFHGGDLTIQGRPSAGSSGLPGRVLHEDPEGRYRLVVARFASGQPTPIHSHRRWGLECGVSGKERFTVWTQTGDDDSPLEVLTDHHIEKGDLGYWYDAPRNVHRQWAEGGEPSCVVIVLGGDGARLHHFDLETGAKTPV